MKSNGKKICRISVVANHVTLNAFYTNDAKNALEIVDSLNLKYVPTTPHATSEYTITVDTYDDTSTESINHTHTYNYDMIVTLDHELDPIAFHINKVIPWDLQEQFTGMIADVSNRVPDIYYVSLMVTASDASDAIVKAKELIEKELPMIENW